MNTHQAAVLIIAATRSGDDDEARRLLNAAWRQGKPHFTEVVLTVAGIASDHMTPADVEREFEDSRPETVVSQRDSRVSGCRTRGRRGRTPAVVMG